MPSLAAEPQTFAEILAAAESRLLTYYELSSPAQACTYLLHEAPFDQPQPDGHLPPRPARAAVLVSEAQASQELFIGLFFSADLQAQLCAATPQAGLNLANIDAYCVLIEELSHFHLLLQRADQKRHVSQLELEWQGEIDKMLLAALLLQEQVGKPHLHALQQLIFERCSIDADSDTASERYHEASKQAGRFWQRAISQGLGASIPLTHRDFRQLMQANFHRPLQEKALFHPQGLKRR